MIKWADGIAVFTLVLSVVSLLVSGTTAANGPPPSAAVVVDASGGQAGKLDSLMPADEVGMIAAQVENPAPPEPMPPESTLLKPAVPAAGPPPEEATSGPPASLPPKPASSCVNINTADEAGLTALKGVGPALAANIAAYRTRYGPFKKKDDLQKVKGIGPAKFAQIADHICL